MPRIEQLDFDFIMGNAIKKAKAKGMAKLAEDPSKFQEQVIAAIEAST